jgi:hypothetical protein
MLCNNNLNGKPGLYLAQNCPDHPGIQITGARITEGPLYQNLAFNGSNTSHNSARNIMTIRHVFQKL